MCVYVCMSVCVCVCAHTYTHYANVGCCFKNIFIFIQNFFDLTVETF